MVVVVVYQVYVVEEQVIDVVVVVVVQGDGVELGGVVVEVGVDFWGIFQCLVDGICFLFCYLLVGDY